MKVGRRRILVAHGGGWRPNLTSPNEDHVPKHVMPINSGPHLVFSLLKLALTHIFSPLELQKQTINVPLT